MCEEKCLCEHVNCNFTALSEPFQDDARCTCAQFHFLSFGRVPQERARWLSALISGLVAAGLVVAAIVMVRRTVRERSASYQLASDRAGPSCTL